MTLRRLTQVLLNANFVPPSKCKELLALGTNQDSRVFKILEGKTSNCSPSRQSFQACLRVLTARWKEHNMWPLPQTNGKLDSASFREVANDLRRDEDLIHLCARGARKLTIQSLLGRISENRIKEINVLFHGDRKVAKTRSHEYYTETIARRRDASLIMAWYRQLAKVDMPVVARYISLHDLHLSQYTAETPYDIDETIRLSCAIDLDKRLLNAVQSAVFSWSCSQESVKLRRLLFPV